jgi:hypothetical protein
MFAALECYIVSIFESLGSDETMVPGIWWRFLAPASSVSPKCES